MLRILLGIAALLSTFSLASQNAWTMEQCMQYAVDHNPQVYKQSLNNSRLHQDYLEAIGRFLPTIQGSTSAGLNFGRALGEDNTYIDENTLMQNYGVSGSLTLFDGLANLNNLKMRRITKAQGKHQLQSNKDVVAYQTMETFLNALYFQKTVTLCHEQLLESQQQLVKIQRMKELGMKSPADVAEAEAKEAEDEYNLTCQKNILAIGIILLKEKMNFPIDEDLTIADFTDERMICKMEESPLSIYNTAINLLPQSIVANARVQASQYAYHVAKAAWLPSIFVSGGYGTSFYRVMDGSVYESYKRQLSNKQGQYFNFTLSAPIFSGFRRSASVKCSRVDLLIVQSERDDELRKIYSDIEQAVADMNGQVDEYNQSQKQINAMNVAHQINLKKYEEGLVSSIDLSTSANRLLKAKAAGLNSLYKYHLKSRLVAYYQGMPYLQQ